MLRKYLDALTAGDLDAIADSFAEDATWSIHGTLPVSGTRHGRAAIMEFLISAGSLYQPGTQSFTFGQVTAEADRAVLEWRVRGTASATGREYDNAYCGVFRVRDGRSPRSASTSTHSMRPRSCSATPRDRGAQFTAAVPGP